ncbi:hypothetical protein B0H66DRAFT_529033 [Apodospora peruviana]|uniref:Uncharacterized protein n=1 Tax=Apodospora peruviana TaxID=516989 RepID=A0AAE0MAH5_9PEZI|nr:hypothetical protein B0H66DRAFT_529033 [Apodospora peruviana]
MTSVSNRTMSQWIPKVLPTAPSASLETSPGILTFALGVFSFCAAFYAIRYNAHREFQDLKDAVEERKSHVDELERYFEELDVAADADFEQSPIKPIIGNSLSSLKERHLEMESELNAIKGRFAMVVSTKRNDVVAGEDRDPAAALGGDPVGFAVVVRNATPSVVRRRTNLQLGK